MIKRFGRFVIDISLIYKNVQKIKKVQMERMGLKGSHVMCLNCLKVNEKGMTAAEISHMIKEDKAGISRAMSDLLEMGFIEYREENPSPEKRRYRARAVLTEKGNQVADKMGEMIVDAVCYAGENLTNHERAVFYKVLGEISSRLDEYVLKI